MKLNFQTVLGLGLIGFTIYDISVSGFEWKHLLYIGIALLPIFIGYSNSKKE